MARRGENIHKRKDGRWEGRYIKARTPEGKIQWGYVYGTVYAEVKRVLIQKKAEAGFYNLKRTDLIFEALAEVWLHSQRNAVKESTYAHYSYTLHKYLLPVLSKVPVASLEESFLEQAMQQIIAPIDAAHKPLGNSSARECLSMLRRICKYAAHLRLIRPMELEVALPKAIDKISAPLSPAEQQRLYQYVQENPTPRKIGLLLGLELGLRIGEICGLQWGDFDLKLGTLKINRTVCRISCGNRSYKGSHSNAQDPHFTPGNSNPKAAAYYAEKAARMCQQCCMVSVWQRVQAHRAPLLPKKHQIISETGNCPASTSARAAPYLCNDLSAGGVRCKDPQRIVRTR